MIGLESIFTIIFFVFLAVFLYLKRKQIVFQKILSYALYFAMYRTKLGIKTMQTMANKLPRLLRILAIIGVVLGFVGMIFISGYLVLTLIKIFTASTPQAGVALVLPIKAKGVFYVPFFYWIISIFVIAVVHEFSHGVIAKLHKVKIKSSGFAFMGVFLPIIPAAFVEPDEKALKKRSTLQQLGVFAAGPFSNILLSILCIGLLFALSPLANSMIINSGVTVTQLQENYAAEIAGIPEGSIILAVDNVETLDLKSFTETLISKRAGDIVSIHTNQDNYDVILSENPTKEGAGYLGVFISQKTEIKESLQNISWLPSTLEWILGLIFMIYVLSLGIGLFNLLPIGPLDGGRMLRSVSLHFFKEDKALKVYKVISTIFLIILLGNLFSGFF